MNIEPMENSNKDNLLDVAEHLPTMSSGTENKPAGTVVSNDGTRITLGEKPSHISAISSTQGGMNIPKA